MNGWGRVGMRQTNSLLVLLFNDFVGNTKNVFVIWVSWVGHCPRWFSFRATGAETILSGLNNDVGQQKGRWTGLLPKHNRPTLRCTHTHTRQLVLPHCLPVWCNWVLVSRHLCAPAGYNGERVIKNKACVWICVLLDLMAGGDFHPCTCRHLILRSLSVLNWKFTPEGTES